jgi:hypothetical protein
MSFTRQAVCVNDGQCHHQGLIHPVQSPPDFATSMHVRMRQLLEYPQVSQDEHLS